MRSVLIFTVVCSLFILVSVAWMPTLFLPQQLARRKNSQPGNMQPRISSAPNRATFAVFTNGLEHIFEGDDYYLRTPQAYIERDQPQTVIIALDSVTWRTFFNSLPISLDEECFVTDENHQYCTNQSQTLQFYLNEKPTPGVLDQPIRPGDQLLITYGEETDTEIKLQLTKVPKVEPEAL